MKQNRNPLIQLHNVYVASSGIYKNSDIKNISLDIYTNETLSVICEDSRVLDSIALVTTGKIGRYAGDITFDRTPVPQLQLGYTKELRNLLGAKIKYISNHSETCLIPTLKIEESFYRIYKEQEIVNFSKGYRWAKLEERILIKARSDEKTKNFFENRELSTSTYVKLHETERLLLHYKQLARQYRATLLYSIWATKFKLKTEKKETIEDSIEIFKKNNENFGMSAEQINDLVKRANKIYEDVRKEDRKTNTSKIKRARKLLKLAKVELRNTKVERIDCRTTIEKEINWGKAKARSISSEGKLKKIEIPKFVYRDIEEWEDVEALHHKVRRVKKNIKQYVLQQKDKKQYKKVWRRYQPYLYFSDSLKNYILKEVSDYLDYFSSPKVEERWKNKAINELEAVGLSEGYLSFKPEELNEIEKLKTGIAISLFTNPSVIFFRDPHDIDLTLRGQILKLISDIREERKFSLIFLTTNILQGLSLASYTYILSRYVVEHGKSDVIATSPTHPYTRMLLERTLSLDIIPDKIWETQRIKYLLLDQNKEIQIGRGHYVFGSQKEVQIWLKDRDHFEAKKSNEYITRNTEIVINIKT